VGAWKVSRLVAMGTSASGESGWFIGEFEEIGVALAALRYWRNLPLNRAYYGLWTEVTPLKDEIKRWRSKAGATLYIVDRDAVEQDSIEDLIEDIVEVLDNHLTCTEIGYPDPTQEGMAIEVCLAEDHYGIIGGREAAAREIIGMLRG